MSEPKDEMRSHWEDYEYLSGCLDEEPEEEPEEVVKGCRKDEKGYNVGRGCDKWTTCPRCQCCYIHCLCQPDHFSEQDDR